MFSTPLIWSSIGDTTVEATTSALAPGYCPVTLMTGGAISGYWATGRRKNDTAPTITNTTDITAAKIGRSMKKCEMRIALPHSVLGWARAHQAVDDDAVIFLQAALYHAQVVERLPERHVFHSHDIV